MGIYYTKLMSITAYWREFTVTLLLTSLSLSVGFLSQTAEEVSGTSHIISKEMDSQLG